MFKLSLKTQDKEFFKFLYATIAVFFSIAVLIPIIPHYVQAVLKANDFAVGSIMAMQAVGAISSRMIVGSIIGSRGTRAAMVLGSYICVLGSLCYFLPSSLLTLGFSRLLQGVGEGFVFTSGTTWVLNTAPHAKRGQMVAFFGLSLWLGSTFAPPLGAFAIAHFGFNAAWALSSVGAILGLFLIRNTHQKHEKTEEKARLEWIPKESLRPGLTLCLASCGYVAIATFSGLFFMSKNWQGGSLSIAAFGLGFVAMRFFGGTLLDRLSVKVVAGYSAILGIIGLLGVSLAPHPYLFIFFSLIAGLGMALMYPALAIAAVHGVKLSRQGTIIGWYTVFWDLSLFLGNLIFGWIACVLNYQAVFIAAMLAALASLLFIISWKRDITHLSANDKDLQGM